MSNEQLVEDGYNPAWGEAQLALAKALRAGRSPRSEENTPPSPIAKTSEEKANAFPSISQHKNQVLDQENAA